LLPAAIANSERHRSPQLLVTASLLPATPTAKTIVLWCIAIATPCLCPSGLTTPDRPANFTSIFHNRYKTYFIVIKTRHLNSAAWTCLSVAAVGAALLTDFLTAKIAIQ
jgi:hypothetical protein